MNEHSPAQTVHLTDGDKLCKLEGTQQKGKSVSFQNQILLKRYILKSDTILLWIFSESPDERKRREELECAKVITGLDLVFLSGFPPLQ